MLSISVCGLLFDSAWFKHIDRIKQPKSFLCENVSFRRTVSLPHYDDEIIDFNWYQLHHRYAGIVLD